MSERLTRRCGNKVLFQIGHRVSNNMFEILDEINGTDEPTICKLAAYEDIGTVEQFAEAMKVWRAKMAAERAQHLRNTCAQCPVISGCESGIKYDCAIQKGEAAEAAKGE